MNIHVCVHPTDVTDARAGRDPTKTYRVRARMRAEGDRRWQTLARTARQALVEHDLLGMRGVGRIPHGDKAEGFGAWLREELRQKVLGYDGRWLRPYIQQTADIAQRRAEELAPEGVHDSSRVATMQIFAASELRGIVEAAQQQIVRAVTHCLMANDTPYVCANAVASCIQTMRNRTRAMSEYVIAKTYATTTLSVFRDAGVSHVGVIPERLRRPQRVRDAGPEDEPRDPHGKWTSGGGGAGDIVAYHGTAARLAEVIAKDGIRVQSDKTFASHPNAANFYKDDRGHSVFVATNLDTAIAYGSQAEVKRSRQGGGEFAVLEVHIPQHEWASFKADLATPLEEKAFYRPKAIPPEWIKKVHTYKNDKFGLPDWKLRNTITLRDAPDSGVIYLVYLLAEHASDTLDARRVGPGSRVSRSKTPSASTIARIAKAQQKIEAELEVEEVDVITAGDDYVCIICEDIAADSPYTLEEAESLIPAHPFCRCAFTPAGTYKDAFDPDQPRDPHGRWTAGGAEEPDAVSPPLSHNQVHELATKVARDMGFDPLRIDVVPGTRLFEVNGVMHTAAGDANISMGKLGRIRLYAEHLNADSVPAVTAHEIEHEKFQEALDAYRRESNAIWSDPGPPPDPKSEHWWERRGGKDAVVRPDGTPWPPYDKKYPHYTAMEAALFAHDTEEFARGDGVSNYSAEYWKAFHEVNGGITRKGISKELAMHETLAEMARIKYTTGKFPEHYGYSSVIRERNQTRPIKESDIYVPKQSGEREGTALWRDLYRTVDRIYKEEKND